jgi:hypothetical protein
MKNRSKKMLELLDERAFPRDKWIDEMRDQLGGALGEYAKTIISRNIGEKDFWQKEVQVLLRKIILFMEEIETKSNFDRNKAFIEAVRDSIHKQFQVTAAKNIIAKMYHNKYKKIIKLQLDSKLLMLDMIKEYLPEYYPLVKDI